MSVPQSKAPPRRTNVERGIYRSVSGKLEVCWSEGGKVFFRVAKEQTITGARAERGDILARRHNHEPVAQSKLTFAQLFEAWTNSKAVRDLAERSRKRYLRQIELHALPAFGHRKIRDIGPDEIATHLEDVQTRLAGSTAVLYLQTLKRIFGFAASGRRGWIARNPIDSLEPHERPKAQERERRTVTEDEFQRLLDHSYTGHRLPFLTLWASGLRIGELCGLQWGDVDLATGILHVRRQVTEGKVRPLKTAAAYREVPIPDALVAELRRHKLASSWSSDTDPVFPTVRRDGEHRTPRSFQRGFDQAAEKAGLNQGHRKLTLHDLRHSWGSHLISEGADLAFVSRAMGHASLTVTLGIYTHVWKAERHADTTREILGKAMESLTLKLPAIG
jgi:integrase